MPLRKGPLTLHGGCFCRTIRYTINIPAFSERPVLEKAPQAPLGPQTEIEKRLPVITVDHCHSCRHATGVLMQNWVICPQRWVEFTVTTKDIGGEEQERTHVPTQDLIAPSADLQGKCSIRSFSSSEHAVRTFCGTCGTNLFFYYGGPDNEMAKPENWGPYCDITLGSLDEEFLKMEELRPARQVHRREAVGWLGEVLDGATEVFRGEGEKV
ncbi:hypothetical protein BP5796_04883 [Coleophoma crateriformis]|uniref:CENP-V/GFA domain-containing protein n=1 Tax=Coleophoma crateriformis TaxID=565419 RepID=A0A3D8SAJ7_9HELO|nr:hypothetical protein BP5796_04883 [Coleophoma crateriformis]